MVRNFGMGAVTGIVVSTGMPLAGRLYIGNLAILQ